MKGDVMFTMLLLLLLCVLLYIRQVTAPLSFTHTVLSHLYCLPHLLRSSSHLTGGWSSTAPPAPAGPFWALEEAKETFWRYLPVCLSGWMHRLQLALALALRRLLGSGSFWFHVRM